MIVTDELHRDEPTHTYWKTKEKKRVVGVTELLAAHRYVDGGRYAKPFHLRRGKNAHLALHYHEKGLLGQGPGLDRDALSPAIRPYVDSYDKLVAALQPTILHTEIFLFDPIGQLACQCDSVWRLGRDRIVVDYKTGPVYDWVKYQTAAAVNGLLTDERHRTRNERIRRFGVQLMADGSQAQLTEFEEPPDLMRVRMLAATFYTWVNDGVWPWPQTIDQLQTERSDRNGLELFPGADANGGAADRNGETEAEPAAAAGPDAAAAE